MFFVNFSAFGEWLETDAPPDVAYAYRAATRVMSETEREHWDNIAGLQPAHVQTFVNLFSVKKKSRETQLKSLTYWRYAAPKKGREDPALDYLKAYLYKVSKLYIHLFEMK